MIILFLITILGFLSLIKGANFLIDGASALAKKLKVSDIFIGLTIISFGTSSPELFVNLSSSIKGTTQITIGNILGSNIFNLLFILGLSSVIFPLAVTSNTVWKEIPLNFFSVIILGILINDKIIDFVDHSSLSRIDGLILLVFFIFFLAYTFSIVKNSEFHEEDISNKQLSIKKSVVYIILGFLALIVGGKVVVESAVKLAFKFNVNQSLIGLTIVAFGTSLPELVTSSVAAYKKNADIAVGNVIGSNIFNIFFILGLSTVITPISLKLNYNIDILVLLLSSCFLFIFMFTGIKKKIDRWEGLLFIVGYLTYLAFIIFRK